MLKEDNQYIKLVYENLTVENKDKFELIYESIIDLRNRYFSYPVDRRRYWDHGIFYEGISSMKFKTDLQSVKSLNTDKESITDDHIFSPQKYSNYAFTNILNWSLEQFIDIFSPLCLTSQVTKKENRQCQALELKCIKENNFIINKHKVLNIEFRKHYDKYLGLPDELTDCVSHLPNTYDYSIDKL